MILDVGCGKDWKERNVVGIDIVDFGQEHVHDITVAPWPIGDNSVKGIICHNTLEHIPAKDVITVLNEMYRVLKPGGKADLMVPKWNSHASVYDPTHKSKWQHVIEGDKVAFFVGWDGEPKAQFTEETFKGYFAGKRPRNADYGIKKWAIENDGKGNYTWEITDSTIRVRLVKR